MHIDLIYVLMCVRETDAVQNRASSPLSWKSTNSCFNETLYLPLHLYFFANSACLRCTDYIIKIVASFWMEGSTVLAGSSLGFLNCARAAGQTPEGRPHCHRGAVQPHPIAFCRTVRGTDPEECLRYPCIEETDISLHKNFMCVCE